MTARLKSLFSSSLFWQCLAALLAVCMVVTPFAIYNNLVDKGPSWIGLDVSWKMTLNYAFIHNWIWGKDIVYTYGPLAFLSTRIGWGIPVWIFVFFDLFLAVNFWVVFADFLKNNQNKAFAIITLIGCMLIINPIFGTNLSWVMLFFIIYWMIKTFDDPRPVFLIILIVVTVLAFYIKMNTGLIAMVLLALHFINLLVSKRITVVKLLACCALLIVLVFASAMALHVSIPGYITGSLQIIKGYNDVMYLDEIHPRIEVGLYLLFFLMTLWFLFKLWRQFSEKKYNQMLYTIAGILYIFLLQKQSVLRNDMNHLFEYLSFAPLMLLCGFDDTVKQKQWLKYYPFVIIAVALFFISAVRPIGWSLGRRISGPVDYVRQLAAYNPNGYGNQPDKRKIPQRVLNLIGDRSVDIFPWDSEYAFENHLNYKPRPVFQSFSAYTEALEEINYNYYLKHAPDFLVYNYDAIDDRYPFNDESLVNLLILNNYTVADTFKSNERLRVLLQRKSKITPLRFTSGKRSGFSLTDNIAIANTNFIKLDINYNLAGKIRAFFYKPPHVQISYMRDDGKWFSYKTSVELLKGGLFIGNLTMNDEEFLSVLTGKHISGIKKIKIDDDENYFSKERRIETYRVNTPDLGGLKEEASFKTTPKAPR